MIDTFKDREQAKLYCASFISWMKGGLTQSPRSSSKALMEHLLALKLASEYLINSYETEIDSLKKRIAELEGSKE